MNSTLLVLGAGGHGRVVADCALATGQWSGVAFLPVARCPLPEKAFTGNGKRATGNGQRQSIPLMLQKKSHRQIKPFSQVLHLPQVQWSLAV